MVTSALPDIIAAAAPRSPVAGIGAAWLLILVLLGAPACGGEVGRGEDDAVGSAVVRRTGSGPCAACAPRIFYADLASAPKSGGQDGDGAFVTIYGRGFGATRGNSIVTVGAGHVARYPVWTDQRVTFQLGPAVRPGDIVLQRAGGGRSNPVPLAIHAGTIYFVSPLGDDAADGSWEHPWKELARAKERLRPGDILYALDGVRATALDGTRAALCIAERYGCRARSGTARLPIALVAYPGARVSVGCRGDGCPQNGLRLFADYWTVAGLQVVGSRSTYAAAVSLEAAEGKPGGSVGQRLVACDITGGYYGITLSTTSACQVLGNRVHDTPHSAIYHGGWGPSSGVEIGWNRVHDLGAQAFGIKAYGHTPNDVLQGLRIHHNTVHDTRRAAILVGGSDGGTPWVRDAIIAGNVIWNVHGPGEGAIRIGNAGVDETLLDADIIHNTVYACTPSLQIDAAGAVRVRNNLFVQQSGVFARGALARSGIVMDHNGYFGNGIPPTADTSPISGNARFVDAAGRDFHLSAASDAIDQGRYLPGLDDGYCGGTPDLGAYEYCADVHTSVNEEKDSQPSLPLGSTLAQNYPNPFNATTCIPYELAEPAHVALSVYDLGGRRVVDLVDAWQEAGRYTVQWDGRDVAGKAQASGLYFSWLCLAGRSQTGKLVLLR